MGKKMIFFDIDGTLLDEEKKLPTSTKESIKQLQNGNVEVAIATGRAPFMFKELREELGIHNYVSFNGQYVLYQDEILEKNPLHRESLSKLESISMEKEIPIVYMDQGQMVASVSYHPYVEKSLASLKFPHPPNNSEYYLSHDIYQALLFCKEQEEEPFIHSFPEFHFVRWHEFSTDILPAGGSKANGIKKIIERANVKIEDVFAFGDGLNDIEMLTEVGTGIAMGNGKEELKKVANYTTTSVEEDGVYLALKHFGLIK